MRIRPFFIANLLFLCGVIQPQVYATDSPLPNDTNAANSSTSTDNLPTDTTAAEPNVYAADSSLPNDTNVVNPPVDTIIAEPRPYAADSPSPNDTNDTNVINPPIDTTITQSPVYANNNTIPNGNNKAAVIIRGIEIYGNATTRPEILKLFFGFEIGDTLDASRLAAARARLLRTELYEKVDIFPHLREDGAHIFVVLKEAVRVSFAGGMTYYTRKYGIDDLWLVASADATLYNFRGRLEEASVSATLWDHRSVSLYWHKPFLSNPYYLSAATSVSHYPDEALPVDFLDVFAKMTAGRSVSRHSSIHVSAIPIYRHRNIVESKAESDSANIIDSIAFRDKSDFYEVFGAAGFAADFRARRFDPHSGWSLNSELRTNYVYSGVNAPFFQFRGEFRYYLPLLFDDMAALRAVITLRDADAGAYHRLTSGSTGSLRGYYEQALGWRFVANSSILASIKYIKPVWETPPLPFPVLGAVYGGRNEITYRIDAALIADYARLYEKPLGALSFRGQSESGIGLGFGTRVVIPDIRQSGCIDLVFGRREDKDGGGHVWKPTLHIYFDLFY